MELIIVCKFLCAIMMGPCDWCPSCVCNIKLLWSKMVLTSLALCTTECPLCHSWWQGNAGLSPAWWSWSGWWWYAPFQTDTWWENVTSQGVYKRPMSIKACFKINTRLENNAVITEVRKGLWRCRPFEHIQYAIWKMMKVKPYLCYTAMLQAVL